MTHMFLHRVEVPNEYEQIKNDPYLSIEEKRKRLVILKIKKLEHERDHYRELARMYAKKLGIESNI